MRGSHRDVKSPVKLGIGDDCALFYMSEDRVGLITTDTLIEDTHFRLKWTDLFSLGRKSLNVNLSDVAAMGGLPLFYTLSLGLPSSLLSEEVEAFYAGLDDAATAFGVQLVGGDTCNSPLLMISITLVGESVKDTLVLRKGAKPGDLLAISGVPGLSAVGLEALERGISHKEAREAIAAHLDPSPKVELGRLLADRGVATAMIDTSDGLAWDCQKIAQESGVAVVLERKSIPLPIVPQDFAHDPLFYALHGGEDYQLLFTLSPLRMPVLAQICNRLNERITIIGRVEEGEGVFIEEEDSRVPLEPEGFKHF